MMVKNNERTALLLLPSSKNKKIAVEYGGTAVVGSGSSSSGGDDDDDDDDDDSSLSPTSSPSPSLSKSIQKFSRRLGSFIQEHTGSIGVLGSFSIAINSLTGPAMLNLPATYSRSGIIPTTASLIFVCLLSAFCSLHMANTISTVPNNATFTQEMEYSTVFGLFWGMPWFYVTELLFFGCILCLNTSSIVDTAQVVDSVLGHTVSTVGVIIRVSALFLDENQQLQQATSSSSQQSLPILSWHTWNSSHCTYQQMQQGDCIPFFDIPKGNSGGDDDDDDILLLFTIGKLVVTVIFLPLALLDLKENAAWQVVAMFILLITSCQFIYQFATWPALSSHNITWWGHDWGVLFGVVLFNFALVIAIPAWLYEREPHVKVPAIIHSSSWIATVLYVAIGILGCMAMPNVSDNMLESMMSGAFGTAMQIGASIFSFFIVGFGIPLFSVLTRLNLTSSGMCSRSVGNILAVYLPFTLAWLLSDGEAVTKLLGWGGVIFTSLVAFVFPLLLAIYVVKKYDHVAGSIQVYGGMFQSKKAQLLSLRILLGFAVISILVAIGGNFVE